MEATTNESKARGKPAESSSTWTKVAVFAVVGLVIGAVYFLFGDQLTLESLAQRETQLREYQANYPAIVFGLAFLIYVAITGLSLPGAAPLTLLYGWYFGFLKGLLLVSFASTLGATIAFLLSRYLFRNAIQSRFGDQLSKFNESLQREGAFYLFTLRLIPAVPFFVINAVMGLTHVKTSTFWWVSQLGMLAGTMVFVYAGSSVPNLTTLADKGVNAAFSPAQMTQIIAAFVFIGVLPLAAKWGIKQWSNRTKPQTAA